MMWVIGFVVPLIGFGGAIFDHERYSSPYIVDEMYGLAAERRPDSFHDGEAYAALLEKSEGLNGGTAPIAFFDAGIDIYGPTVVRDAFARGPVCHSRAHNLGRALYERSHDLVSSMAFCGNLCTMGCVHGAVMSFMDEKARSVDVDSDSVSFATLPLALREELRGLCDSDGTVRDATQEGNCYHTAGHAIASITNDSPSRALDICRIFEDTGLAALYYCATGVYMQRDADFGGQDLSTSTTYPCQGSSYPGACFRYKLQRTFDLDTEYQTAIAVCESLESDFDRRGCFHGLGAGAYRVVLADPSKLDVICGSAHSTKTMMCLEGVFGNTNIEDPLFASRACTLYEGDPDMCHSAARINNFGMDRNFAPYVRE